MWFVFGVCALVVANVAPSVQADSMESTCVEAESGCPGAASSNDAMLLLQHPDAAARHGTSTDAFSFGFTPDDETMLLPPSLLKMEKAMKEHNHNLHGQISAKHHSHKHKRHTHSHNHTKQTTTSHQHSRNRKNRQPQATSRHHRNAQSMKRGTKAVSDGFELFHLSQLPTYESCIVVGSSGAMAGRKKGSFIDGHSAVFRINKAPTKSFEDDVGVKTTARFCNVHNYNCDEDVGESVEFVVMKPQINVEPSFDQARKLGEARSNGGAILPKESWLRDMQATVGLERKEDVTSGLTAVAVAQSMCETLDIIGFDSSVTFASRIGADTVHPYHYYDDAIPMGGFAGTSHDFGKENEMICSDDPLLHDHELRAKKRSCVNVDLA